MAASGAGMQDASGAPVAHDWPIFHDWPAPGGPAISELGAWGAAARLSAPPGGGYRPQVAVGSDGTIHVVYYEQTDQGDLIRHRRSTDGRGWSEPEHLGHDRDRNWGPDLVARSDGSVVVVYDHALEDFSSTGFLTVWRDGVWSDPEALTVAAPDQEVGSGHVAHGPGDTLAYVYIGKRMSLEHHFEGRWRWFDGTTWSEVGAFSDGSVDAWHANVERRPDGSMLVGYDLGLGGTETRLTIVEGRDGVFGEPEDIAASGKPGERPHFAFGTALGSQPGPDHITWFHKESARPRHVYVRSGSPGAWGPVVEPTLGLGGYQYDPDIAINAQGVRCLVWGWDSGETSELVYSLDLGEGWTRPRRVAEVGWGKAGLPSIDVDATGAFHVVWNQGVRGEHHVYYARLAAPDPA